MGAAAIIGGAAILGGIAGSKKDKSTVTSSSENVQEVITDVATQKENDARDLALKQVNDLDTRLRSIESSATLQNLDRLLAELGGTPTQERIQQAQAFTQDVFAPAEQSIQQAFQDQQVDFARRAAQMGRSSADPILAAKLAQAQVRERSNLEAQKTAFRAQETINAPLRQFQNQLAGLGGLSQQAVANRQAVYSLGSDFANTLMNYRLATATRTGKSTGTQTSESGGGFKGAITGAFGAASAGAGIAQGAGLFSSASFAPQMAPSAPMSGPSVGGAFGMAGPSSGFNYSQPMYYGR